MSGKIVIVYDSKHKGNTEKVLLKIKEKHPEIVLAKACDFASDDVDCCDAVGFASGIYYGRFSKTIEKLFEQSLTKSGAHKFFFIYTAGAGKVGYEKTLRAKTEKSGKTCLGIFGCKGFDEFGPFKLFGGLNKGKPNENNFKNAIDFFEKNICCQKACD